MDNENLERNKPMFCMEYNQNKCEHQSSHEGHFRGKKVIKWHICRRCRRFNEILYHPECEASCPRRKWLETDLKTNKKLNVDDITNMDEGFNVRDFLETSNMTEAQIDYCEFWTTANRIVHESGMHNYREAKIQCERKTKLWIFRQKIGWVSQ